MAPYMSAVQLLASRQCNFCSRTELELNKKFQRCSVCKTTYYCSEEHHKTDWKTHKEVCKSFKEQKENSKDAPIYCERLINKKLVVPQIITQTATLLSAHNKPIYLHMSQKVSDFINNHPYIMWCGRLGFSLGLTYAGTSLLGKIGLSLCGWIGTSLISKKIFTIHENLKDKFNSTFLSPSFLFLADQRETKNLIFAPLSNLRPTSLLKYSINSLENAVKLSKYVYNGRADYDFQILKSRVNSPSASEFIKDLALKKSMNCEPFLICDLGTGDGSFLLNLLSMKNIIGYGTSVKDTRSPIFKNSAINDNFIIGDLENISKYFLANSFDVCVSALTFQHLTDPLRALCQVYEILKPNGFLIIDNFRLKGLNLFDLKSLIANLNQNGYEVEVKVDVEDVTHDIVGAQVQELMIKKTNQHLILPIQYDEEPVIEMVKLGHSFPGEKSMRANYKSLLTKRVSYHKISVIHYA